jgi:hypothetical protein
MIREQSGWLTHLGRRELDLTRELGWDHDEVKEARNRFKDAYQAVKSIRNSYEASPSKQRNYD